MKILVTGTAGFIGFHLAQKLIARGDEVVGLDNINDYYEPSLKYDRMGETGIEQSAVEYNRLIKSTKYSNYRFIKLELKDKDNLFQLFEHEKFDRVCHLAAQAGVRYSITHPYAYLDSNMIGFMNILEACRHNKTEHLTYASSSSVYGMNESMPFSTHDNVDHPISLYAASKKSNELMAHTYSHLYSLPTTGLRFFTVYGPWGRPDMALFLFTKAILNNQQIDVYNNGNMQRDFTYIDDIIEGVIRVIDHPPSGNPDWNGEYPDPASSPAPYRIYNIGNNNPVHLMDFIRAIEKETGREAKKNFMPMQPGDVYKTWADVNDLIEDFGYRPRTDIREGVKRFVEWFKAYYNV
ncbi:MAG: NAD-dependent epimerase [Bacteroidales bacterium]|nr:NAD-dependent epimerase [Bacteroidales bacterium]